MFLQKYRMKARVFACYATLNMLYFTIWCFKSLLVFTLVKLDNCSINNLKISNFKFIHAQNKFKTN